MSSNPEFREGQPNPNLQIVACMDRIFQRESQFLNYEAIIIMNVSTSPDPNHGVSLSFNPKTDPLRVFFDSVPVDFKNSDYYSFVFLDKEPVSTPYGILKEFAIGGEKLWRFTNSYVFDKDGYGARFEQIKCRTRENETLESTVKRHGFNPDEITKIDFEPKEENSRLVDIEPGEYEEILEALRQIGTDQMSRS